MTVVADIPTVYEAPAAARDSAVRRQIIKGSFSRRSVLKGIIASAIAISLSSLEWIWTRNRANALPTTWQTCTAWQAQPGTTQDWSECNPDGSSQGYISGTYCGDNNYHRKDQENVAPNTVNDYSQRFSSCAGRNAWEWFRNGAEPDPRARRCSDGKVRTLYLGDQIAVHNSTCRFWLEPPP